MLSYFIFVIGSSGSNPEQVDYWIIYIRLTNWGTWVQYQALEIKGEKII